MRTSIRWCVLVLSASVGSTQIATAQEAKRLFFEADMVRHALEGQAGPFCVLANQFKRNEAVAWRIRERIRAHQFLASDGLSVRLTASIGVATLPDAAQTAEDLLRVADTAMYKVKYEGKDGIHVA